MAPRDVLISKHEGKYLHIRRPSFHLDASVPHIRFPLVYTTNVKSIVSLFLNPALVRYLQAESICPAMQQATAIKTTCAVDGTCSICLERLNNGVDTSILPCQHIFHAACVQRWLNTLDTPSCPLCRRAPPSIQETFEIESISTKLQPRERSRLSTGEIVVSLRVKRYDDDNSHHDEDIHMNCTVETNATYCGVDVALLTVLVCCLLYLTLQ